MPIAFGVDTRHLAPEEFAVRRGVTELINSNIIMDHLVENGILNKFFGQVKAGVDAQFEVLVFPVSEEPFAMLDISDFAEKSAGIRELYGDRRKGTTEETGVVLVKTGLYVRKRGSQFMI